MSVPTPEEWRPIPGFDGYYASNHGRIGSTRRGRSFRVLRPGAGRDDYAQVNLAVEPLKRTICVHRLIARAFIGPRPDGLVVRHLDGDKANNRPENLRYGTPKENSQDTIRHGRQRGFTPRSHCPQGHPYTAGNSYVDPQGGKHCRSCRRIRNRQQDEQRRAARVG